MIYFLKSFYFVSIISAANSQFSPGFAQGASMNMLPGEKSLCSFYKINNLPGFIFNCVFLETYGK